MKNKILGVLFVLFIFFVFSSAEATTLKLGSRGSSVATLQQQLIEKGYLKIANPTNYFGSLTRDAVIAFQKANKITPDGIIVPKTLALLNNLGNDSSNGVVTAISKIKLVLSNTNGHPEPSSRTLKVSF